jgi:hypothetical protein
MDQSTVFSYFKIHLLFYMIISIIGLGFGFKGTFLQASSVVTGNYTDFYKPLEAGKDALYMYNPKNPSQKNLVIPSNHELNLRFVDPKIGTAMKQADLLITEINIVKSNPEYLSWDTAILIGKVFANAASVARLKQFNLIKDTPFALDGTPWTAAIDPASREFLIKNFQPVLGKDINLNNLHPIIPFHILNYAIAMELKKVGMDMQIVRDFTLKGKPTLGLEDDIIESVVTIPDDSLQSAAQQIVTANLLTTIAQNIRSFQEISLQPPKQKLDEVLSSMIDTNTKYPNLLKEFDKLQSIINRRPDLAHLMDDAFAKNTQMKSRVKTASETYKRNQLWIPVLIAYLEAYPDKSIVIVVGANHLVGEQGLLKLLYDLGFRFTKFP